MFWEAGIRDLLALANAGPQPEPVGESNQGTKHPAPPGSFGARLELLRAGDIARIGHAVHLPREYAARPCTTVV